MPADPSAPDGARPLTHDHESDTLLYMSKRLQVLLDEEELAEIQELARRKHQTTAAWVRDALRAARDTANRPDTRRKLQVIEQAAAHHHPTADIDQLLTEIERGYVDVGGT